MTTAAALAFDAEAHRYTIGGREIPSVTTIIGGIFPELFEFSTEFAKERGSIVHETCHLHTIGVLDESSISPIVRPFFEAFLAFIRETGFVAWESERRIYSPTYDYAGTLDLVGKMAATPAAGIVDLKTGDPGWQAGLQLSAYANAYQEETGTAITRRWACWLRDDGTYRLIPYTDHRGDFADFVAARRVYARRAQLTRRAA